MLRDRSLTHKHPRISRLQLLVVFLRNADYLLTMYKAHKWLAVKLGKINYIKMARRCRVFTCPAFKRSSKSATMAMCRALVWLPKHFSIPPYIAFTSAAFHGERLPVKTRSNSVKSKDVHPPTPILPTPLKKKKQERKRFDSILWWQPI